MCKKIAAILALLIFTTIKWTNLYASVGHLIDFQ